MSTAAAPATPSRPAPTPGSSPVDVRNLLAALQPGIAPVRRSPLYHVGALLLAGAMLVLPLIYLALIGAIAWLVYLHAVNDLGMITAVRGRAMILAAAAYAAPIVAGVVAIVFMFKPFLAPRREQSVPLSLERREEPELFAFVDAVARAVHAPAPQRIDVDTQVNASASLRRGLRSFVGNDLVLTIGLPLATTLDVRQFAAVLAHEFGHFAQGGGMRLTFIIRRLAGWFERVVYQRDRWDATLEQWQHDAPHVAILLIVLATRLMVFLSRCVLWVLMWVSHGLSCFMLRQMEYDADRHAARLAGSDATVSLIGNLPQVQLAWTRALQTLQEAFASGRLPDDLPALTGHYRRQLRAAGPGEGHALLALEGRTKLFDTHPAGTDRIKAVRREAAPGLLRTAAPATGLFRDLPRLSRVASAMHYKLVLGPRYDTMQLAPSGTLIQQEQQASAGDDALQRVFQQSLEAVRVWPDWPGEKPAADCRAQVDALRQAMQRDAGKAAKLGRQLVDLEERAARLRVAAQLRGYGIKPEANEPGVHGTDEASLRTGAQLAQQQVAAVRAQADALAQRGRRRIEIALAVLQAQPGDGPAKLAARGRRMLALTARLRDIDGRLSDIRADTLRAASMLQHLGPRQRDEHYVSAVLACLHKLTTQVTGIRQSLGSTPYPFARGSEGVSLGAYLVPDLPPDNDPQAVMNAATGLLARESALYARAMGQLATLVERVEKAMGLAPLPAPGEAKRDR